MTGEDERTAPEITLAEGISGDGSVDEVLLDLGEDTAARGLLDPWTASRSHTGDEATASGRTGELSEDGAGPTDVRLLGELLGFAGSDPERRARALDAAAQTGPPPSAPVVAWLRAQPLPAVGGLVSQPERVPEPVPDPVPPTAEEPADEAPPPVPDLPAPPRRGFWPGLLVGAGLGLLAALGAWVLLGG